jgi:hypothetical protein
VQADLDKVDNIEVENMEKEEEVAAATEAIAAAEVIQPAADDKAEKSSENSESESESGSESSAEEDKGEGNFF